MARDGGAGIQNIIYMKILKKLFTTLTLFAVLAPSLMADNAIRGNVDIENGSLLLISQDDPTSEDADGYNHTSPYVFDFQNDGGVYLEEGFITSFVSAGITITEQPKNVQVYEGVAPTFNIVAENIAPIKYQWYYRTSESANWLKIGSNSPTLKLAAVKAEQNGYAYKCDLTSAAANDIETSDIVYLQVLTKPKIGTQPKVTAVYDGNGVTLSVAATGYALNCQWQKYTLVDKKWIWVDIEGANSSTYSLNALEYSQNGEKYRCEVSNTSQRLNAVYSSAVALSVYETVRIVQEPSDTVAEIGQKAVFSIKTAGTGPIKYQWQERINNVWTAISKATGSTYTIAKVSKADDLRYFRCVVSNGGATLESAVLILYVNANTVISAITGNAVAFAGASATFGVTASAEPSIHYLWQSKTPRGGWTDIADSDASTIEVKNVLKENSGVKYRCYVWSDRGLKAVPVISKEMTLTVADITSAAVSSAAPEAYAGGKVSFKVAAKGYGTLKYQWQESADSGATWSDIAKATGSSYTTPALYGSDFAKIYRCVVANAAGSVESASASVIKLENAAILTQPESEITCTSSETKTISVTATPESGSKVTYKWMVSADGGKTWAAAGSSKNTLEIKKPTIKQNGNLYKCLVSNAGNVKNPAESTTTTLYVKAEALLKTAPKAFSTYQGEIAEFTAEVYGYNTKYQWKLSKDGGKTWASIEGATAATLNYFDEDATPKGAKWLVQCVFWSDIEGADPVYKSTPSAALSVNEKAILTSYTAQQADYNPLDLLLILEETDEISVFDSYEVILEVVASGYGIKYQWYESSDALSWSPIKGAASSIYKTKKFVYGKDADVYYYCRIYNGSESNGTEVITKPVKLNIIDCFAPQTLIGYGMVLDYYVDSPNDNNAYTNTIYFLPTSSTSCKINDFNSYLNGATLVPGSYSYKRLNPEYASLILKYTIYYSGNKYPINFNILLQFLPDEYGMRVAYFELGEFPDGKFYIGYAQSTSTLLSAPASIVGKTLDFKTPHYNKSTNSFEDASIYEVTPKDSKNCTVKYKDINYNGTYSYSIKSGNIAVFSLSFTVGGKAQGLTDTVLAFNYLNYDGSTYNMYSSILKQDGLNYYSSWFLYIKENSE